MRRLFWMAVVGLFTISGQLGAQGINFFEGSWDEAKEVASSEGKMIFLDAFASWCGPCKRLSKQVFPQEAVGNYFNEHFIAFKQDMEKGYGPQLRRAYPVSAYPTLFFISPSGDVVHKIKGAPRTGQDLINAAKQAMAKYDPSAQYRAKYEAGDRSYETVIGYIQSLNKSGESSLRVANEYLEQQSDLSSEQNLRFIYEATSRVDSKIFDHFLSSQDALKKLYTEEQLVDKVYAAANNTVGMAIEFESEELLEEAITKFTTYDPSIAKVFEYEARMSFAKKTKDGKTFLSNAKSLAKARSDGPTLAAISRDILVNFPDDTKAMKMAEKWAAESTELVKKSEYAFNYAQILVTNGKKEEAITLLESTIKKVETAGKSPVKYQNYLNELRGS